MNIEFSQSVYLGRSKGGAREIGLLATGFREDPDGNGLIYDLKVTGIDEHYSAGKEMRSLSLFFAAIQVIGTYRSLVMAEIQKNPQDKLFIKMDGDLLKADLHDVFKSLA